MNNYCDVVIIGGGPAGLTAAYVLIKDSRFNLCLFEANDYFGGIAATIENEGMYFDLGGHRFFTKSETISKLWHELMGGDFLVRPRLSRIYYKGKFFKYPLEPFDALLKLGPRESSRILASFLKRQLFPLDKSSFSGWVSNRFGKRLFEIFFKSYTEKVWGVECDIISPEWASQRIKNLSLSSIVLQSFLKRHEKYTSLIEQFNYPKYGPGMMWKRMRERIESGGGRVFVNHELKRVRSIKKDLICLNVKKGSEIIEFNCKYLISSMPLRDFFSILPEGFEIEMQKTMLNLRYRSLMTVILVLDKPGVFPDNWIYIHSDDVRVSRIQNFNNWSPFLIPNKDITCLGMEYFVFENDKLWNRDDNEIVDLASSELEKLGLAKKNIVSKGFIYRTPKAYPMYIGEYKKAIWTAKEFSKKYPNIQFIGRNGQHRYNNMDHSMLTAIFAAENILGANNDIWAVNIDDEYQEVAKEY